MITCKILHEPSVARFPASKFARAHADYWSVSMECTWPFGIDYRCSLFTVCFLLWYPQKSAYHFQAKLAPLEQGKWKAHCLCPLGIEDDAKFRISSFLKIFVVFLSTRQCLYKSPLMLNGWPRTIENSSYCQKNLQHCTDCFVLAITLVRLIV